MPNSRTSLSDIPFNEKVNDFGTERYVDGLIRFIENSSAPITIALQGEWGSGKTSLMNRLERSLCSKEDSKYIGVNINTWEYSMMSTPEATVFKIIAQLVKQLTKDDPHTKTTFKKFLKNAGNFLYRGARESIKTIPGVGGYVGVGMEAIGIPSELGDDSEENETTTLSDLKQALEQAVDNTIVGGKQGVIVFVDDLDRLNPPVAVEILELLKNIFSINHCIFILAIDYEVVVKGLEPKFGKLTDQNEREFRSFFDKIIQVPFSLPVSSYRPMNFVLDSLVSIGYITAVEKSDDRIRVPFNSIVDKSVGKNPRSIKRLINTLSLLSCIAHCGARDKDSEFLESYEGRIVNFAIVAMQVCYPKIYRMLAKAPDFRKWDASLATSYNVVVKSQEDGPAVEWEDVLESVCSVDKYLKQHCNDILSLLELIKTTLLATNKEGGDCLESRIRSVIDKSSVTGVSEHESVGEVDQKRLIYALHSNVVARIQEKRPDISRIQYKRNTGNGGFFVYLPDETGFEVVFRPRVKEDKVVCELWLGTRVLRPQSLLNKTWDEMVEDPTVAQMYAIMDNCVAPLLNGAHYFEGFTYHDAGFTTYFKSFSEEQKWRASQGWSDDKICENESYYINLANESLFSDRAIVKTIADVVIALYDFHVLSKRIINE